MFEATSNYSDSNVLTDPLLLLIKSGGKCVDLSWNSKTSEAFQLLLPAGRVH